MRRVPLKKNLWSKEEIQISDFFFIALFLEFTKKKKLQYITEVK